RFRARPMASVRAATAAAVVCIAVLLAMLGSGAGEVRRFAVGEPATVASPAAAWQYDAIGLDRVPLDVVAKASPVTVAVVDTGADVSASDFAGRSVSTFSVLKPGAASDANGHGTFVASIVARTAPNARLLVIGAAAADGSMRDEDEAAAIRYAVRHGARVINLSVAGTSTSTVERRALADAARRGVLVVAAAGNDYAGGNPVEYPAALLRDGPRRRRDRRERRPRGILGRRLVALARRAGRGHPRRARPDRRRSGRRTDDRVGRHRERHVVRGAAGRGRGRAPLRREPEADRTARRGDPEEDGVRSRHVDAGDRVRHHRHRRGGGGGGRAVASPAARSFSYRWGRFSS